MSENEMAFRIRQLENALYKAGIECRKDNSKAALEIIKSSGVFGTVSLCKPNTGAKIETDFADFWAELVTTEGALDAEKVKAELFDYHQIMHEVSTVYDDVTMGRFSKPNTAAVYVIDAVNERLESGERFFFSQDCSSHWYLVPLAKKVEWDEWRDLGEGDERAWDAPKWAARLGGGVNFTTFTNPAPK